jgi:hypothetical protein
MELEPHIRAAFDGIRNGYETHRPVLCAAVLRVTQGLILELGAGEGSTPPLHEVCLLTGRPVITLESDPTWHARYASLNSENHTVLHVPSWDELDRPIFRALPYAIAFVDHTPTRRVTDIRWLAGRARILVVHDTESGDYGYEGVFDLFRYSVTYKDHAPWTSVLSNFVDVSGWTFG